MIGALLIALHATQGPKLGVPQTIQSRAQFGFYGSAFLFPAVLLINVGFIAAQLVIQAQAMQGVTGVVSIPADAPAGLKVPRTRGRPTGVPSAHPRGPVVLAVDLRDDSFTVAVFELTGRITVLDRQDREALEERFELVM